MRLPAALEDRVHLRSVRLRSVGEASPDAGIDALRARLSLERALAAADARATGLPPEAVLIVRRLAVRSGGASGPLRASGEAALAQQVDASLRTLARAARRPWREGAVGEAMAVWFADAHELAACLLRDWLRGEVATRWWWRSLLGNARGEDWIQTHVLDDGARLPATLSCLADAGLVVAVVARLTPAQAERALHALVRAHALPSLLLDESTVSAAQAATSPFDAALPEHAADTIPERMALAAALPEPLHTLPDRNQRLLCASALLALRAPSLLRSETAARAVVARYGPPRDAVQWEDPSRQVQALIDSAARQSVPPPLDSASSVRAIATHRHARAQPVAVAALQPSEAPQPHAGLWSAVRQEAANPIASMQSAPRADHDTAHAERAADAIHGHPASADTAANQTTNIAECARPHAVIADDTAHAPPPSLPNAPTLRDAQATSTDVLDTDFGGLLYLLNVALSLGLYADFTQPRAANLALSPWDLLALLGRHWFGDALLRDPLWPQLARLAGRDPRTAPGTEVSPPSTFAPDDAALRPWAPLTALHYCSGGAGTATPWLALRHPDGFTLAFVPRDPVHTPRAQALALCAQRAALAGARLRSRVPVSARSHADADAHAPARGALARWLHACEGFLRARLALALDCTSAQAPALLCRHPAQLRCGPARVEAMFALSSLPLAVRIAGLDRDPGWMPAAGRDVRFHFS
jgi:hypothetical protein